MQAMLCVAVCAGSLSWAPPARSDDASVLAALTPDTSIDILDGRASILAPERTQIIPREHSVMSAPEADARETRLVIDAGSARVVVMAWELLALAPEDLAASVRASLGDAASEREIGPLELHRARLRAVRARPKMPALKADAALLDAAYVELPDGTVIYLAAYTNEVGLTGVTGMQALASRVLRSVAPAGRRLPREAGTRELGDLWVDVPADFVDVTQRGPDFVVYSVYKLCPLGSPQPVLGVYVGDHPSYMSDRAPDVTELLIERTPGRLFGRDITWQAWDADGVRTLEVIEPAAPGRSAPLVHVFATAGSASELAELRAIAETLVLAPASAP
jgi:hypothetical protein